MYAVDLMSGHQVKNVYNCETCFLDIFSLGKWVRTTLKYFVILQKFVFQVNLYLVLSFSSP